MATFNGTYLPNYIGGTQNPAINGQLPKCLALSRNHICASPASSVNPDLMWTQGLSDLGTWSGLLLSSVLKSALILRAATAPIRLAWVPCCLLLNGASKGISVHPKQYFKRYPILLTILEQATQTGLNAFEIRVGHCPLVNPICSHTFSFFHITSVTQQIYHHSYVWHTGWFQTVHMWPLYGTVDIIC